MSLSGGSRRTRVWLGVAALGAVAGLVLWTALVLRIEAPDRPAPRSRDYPWMSLATWWQRHEALVRLDRASKDRAELILLGDSIIEGWDRGVWDQYYAPHHALNLGIGGDKTQHVLWRILHEELDGLHPSVLVLLIGTNNLGANGSPPAAVARGVAQILTAVSQKLPGTAVLLLGILPRDEQPNAPVRRQIAETNVLLARLADGRRVRYLELGQQLLGPDGSISREIMADYLHPTARGYQIVSTAIQPTLAEMLASR